MAKTLLGTVELDVSPPRRAAEASEEADVKALLKKEPELWFRLPGPPKDWEFAFIDDDVLARINDGVECWALTLPSLGLVLFASSLKKRENRRTLQVTFIHEMVHVGLCTDGSNHTVRQAFGTQSAKTADDREEAVAGLLSNNLASSLFANKLMRLPPLPRGK